MFSKVENNSLVFSEVAGIKAEIRLLCSEIQECKSLIVELQQQVQTAFPTDITHFPGTPTGALVYAAFKRQLSFLDFFDGFDSSSVQLNLKEHIPMRNRTAITMKNCMSWLSKNFTENRRKYIQVLLKGSAVSPLQALESMLIYSYLL
jgi:hypothetical protein